MRRNTMLPAMLSSLLLFASAASGASAQEQVIEGEWSDWNDPNDACESPVEHIDANGQSVKSRGYSSLVSGAPEGFGTQFYDDHGHPIDDADIPENEEIRGQAVCFEQPNNHGESVLVDTLWGKSIRFEPCPDTHPYVGVIPGQSDLMKVWVRCQIRANN